MIAGTERTIMLEQLSKATKTDPNDIFRWIRRGYFKPANALEEGSRRTFTIDDALILKATVELVSAMNITVAAASEHARLIKASRRGDSLVVAVGPVAETFGIARWTFYHAESNTYGSLMRTEEIDDGLVGDAEIRTLAIINLARLRFEVIAALGEDDTEHRTEAASKLNDRNATPEENPGETARSRMNHYIDAFVATVGGDTRANDLTPVLGIVVDPSDIGRLLNVSDARRTRVTMRRVAVTAEGLPRFIVTAVRRLKG